MKPIRESAELDWEGKHMKTTKGPTGIIGPSGPTGKPLLSTEEIFEYEANKTTYTIFRHETQPDGRILTHVEDNDDNDDGWPDAKVETYTLGPSKKEVALKPPMDKSHRGCAGRMVSVFLDGKEIK
jgi:hypothetical protein